MTNSGALPPTVLVTCHFLFSKMYWLGAVAHFGVSYEMVHSVSEIWSAAATPPLWLSSQLTVGKEHPLVRPAQPKAKAPPLAAHSKWHRPISKMTHCRIRQLLDR